MENQLIFLSLLLMAEQKQRRIFSFSMSAAVKKYFSEPSAGSAVFYIQVFSSEYKSKILPEDKVLSQTEGLLFLLQRKQSEGREEKLWKIAEEILIPSRFSLYKVGETEEGGLALIGTGKGRVLSDNFKKGDAVLLTEEGEVLNLAPFIIYREGRFWLIKGFTDGSIFYFSSAEERAERDERLFYLLGRFFAENFLFDLASAILGREIYLMLLEKGFRYFQDRKYASASRLLEEARNVGGDFPFLLYILGKCYQRIPDKINLNKIAQTMVEKYPELDRTWEVVADYAFAVSDLVKEENAIKKGLHLNPKNFYLKDKLSKLMERKGRGEEEQKDYLYELTAREDLEEVIGREKELNQLMEILGCRYKNNALVIGESGVGRTSFVEELARRIREGKVPAFLKQRKIYKMDFGKVIAGTKLRGQFEERIMNLLRKVIAEGGILFLDDLHNFLSPAYSRGAGLDIAALLQPFMERGELQVIATTTFSELKNLEEISPSFVRRFQKIVLEELPREEILRVLRQKKEKIEDFHGTEIPEELLESLADMTVIYLPEKKLPERAIEVLDRTSSRVAMQHRMGQRASPRVSVGDVQKVIAEMSGVPEEHISTSIKDMLANLEGALKKEIVGQDEAIEKIVKIIRTCKLNLEVDSRRPDGVFLFVGPTGVGKTETARALARIMFSNEDKLIRLDMSQLMEKHTYSELVGAPPGYVGYYDQNQLTDRIIAQPYSIVLLDEVEKAHPSVLNIFLQVFDSGKLVDARGRVAYFNHATIIMTSNVGTELYFKARVGFESKGVARSEIMSEIKRFFTPEFLNRIDEIIFFRPLELEDVKKIIDLQLREVRKKLSLEEKSLVLTDAAKELIARRGYSPEYGARPLARTIRALVLDRLAELKLSDDWDRARTILVNEKEGEIIIHLSRFQEVELLMTTSQGSHREI